MRIKIYINIPDAFSYVAKNRKIFKDKSGGIVVVYRIHKIFWKKLLAFIV
jgi:hypothetical protein